MANWVKDFLQEHPDLSNKIFRRGEKALHTRNEDGTITAYFTGTPMHYRDEEGIWQVLDTAIKDLGDGTYGAKGVPIRLLQSGLVKLYNEALDTELYSQITSRVAVYNFDTKNIVQTRNLPVGIIDDDKLIKETDIYKHVLTLKERGLREELIIKEKPDFIIDDDKFWFVLDTVVTNITFDDGCIDGEYNKEEYRFPLPKIKDADGIEIPAKRYAKTIDDEQHILTGANFFELYRATYPVYIDPDFTANTDDKEIIGYDTDSWTVARNTSFSENNDESSIRIGITDYYASSFEIWRMYIRFDTSSIGTDDNIKEVKLKMTCSSDDNTDDKDVLITKQDWSSGTREEHYDNALTATLDDSILCNFQNIVTNSAVTSGKLDTSHINKSGSTYYSLLLDDDRDNVEPADNYFNDFYSADETTAAYRPTLIVTYETAIATRKTLLGVGT